ncbi:MAG: hypothetical protein ACPG4M_08610, partial [Alphaproteobacteria bacterium]
VGAVVRPSSRDFIACISLGLMGLVGLFAANTALAQKQDLFRSNINASPVMSVTGVANEAYDGTWRNGVPIASISSDSLEIFQNIPFSGWREPPRLCHRYAGILSILLALDRLSDSRNGRYGSAAVLYREGHPL